MNSQAHILLVDDEPKFRESMRHILELSGYSVCTAGSGTEAKRLLSNTIFDILLLDVELPDILGYEIINFLKDENSEAVAIMMTGVATVETAIKALKNGAYDYLKKPVDHDLLFHSIDKALTHRRLKKALKLSEERAKILADASWEGVVIHRDGLLIDANKQFFEMFGYQEKELLGEQIIDKILSSKSIPEVRSRIWNGIYGSHETIGRKKDGTEFPMETSSRSMSYQGKQVRVCAISDISERVKSEEEKLELQKQLAIAGKMETLGLMAGSVAHDLNNILSGIVTLPELMLMRMEKSHPHRKTIITIQEAGKEAASVVSDLITVARGATAEKQVRHLNTIIQNYAAAIKEKKQDPLLENITIELNCNAGIANIHCSLIHINKVLMNLIGNAAEETEGKGLIRISTTNRIFKKIFFGYEPIQPGHYVVLSVADNGPGIKHEDIKKIFEPFYSKKKMGRSGTGLGLAIVWNTIHDHDGFLDVRSDGNGATFDLYFPVTEELIVEESTILSSDRYRGNGERILVVDDQEKQQLIASDLLQSLGYQPATVGSGEEAIKYISHFAVDLIILDMIMDTGMNGRETYEKVLEINPNQKALIASGFAENDEVKQTLRLGASQFVKKPYTLTQMGLAVKQALAKVY